MRPSFCLTFALIVSLLAMAEAQKPDAQKPDTAPAKRLRLAIAGLEHAHVDGIVREVRGRSDAEIVGVFDADTALHQAFAKRHDLAAGLFYTDLGKLLDETKPDIVSAFTSTYDHAMVVDAAAARHIAVMVEKPLAVSLDHARAIQRAVTRARIPLIVNYATTWYPSHAAIWRLVEDQRTFGDIRKMVALDGHKGPKEIGIRPESLAWVIDPVQDGGGALFDFGCYGANLMTWLMHNQRPTTVTAVTQTNKPHIYARVDDEATIIVQYPKAQGIMQASWNWPFDRKDFEVYGERAQAIAIGPEVLRFRMPGEGEHVSIPQPVPLDEFNSLAYLVSVLRGQRKVTGLSSLENNMIVTEILEAARESARTGRTVPLPPTPPVSTESR